MKLSKTLTSLLLLVVSSMMTMAQGERRTLGGTVTDTAGAAVSGARVILQRETGDPVRQALTDSRGEFRFADLRPKTYRLLVEADGLVQSGGGTEVGLDRASIDDLKVQLAVSALQDGVTVSATRIATPAAQAPASVYLVTADELQRSQRPSVLDVLRSSPGVAVLQTARRGGVTSIFVRGGESDYTKVLIDGIPINAAGGAFDFSDLTTENAERVELVRGAQSALYGSEAMTGVMQFITRRGTSATPEFNFSAEGGSFGFNREFATLAGAAGRFDYSGSFAHLRTRGRDRNDDYQNRASSLNFGYRFSERTALRLTARNENAGLGVPGTTANFFPDPDERARRKRLSTGVRFDDQTLSRWHQSLAFAYSESNQVGFDPAAQDLSRPATPPDTFFAFNDFRNFFGNHQRRRGLRYQSDLLLPASNLLSAGVEYDGERAVFVNGFDGRNRVDADRTNIGVFIQDQFTLYSRWSLTAGLRVENNRADVPASLTAILNGLRSTPYTGRVGFGTKVVPKIATAVTLRSGDAMWGATRLRASYGEGIKAAALLEAFSPDALFSLGNPALRPERSRSFEIGIEQLLWGERARIELIWFENRFRDQIAYVSDPATFGGPIRTPDGRLTHYLNFDRARARGLEFVASLRPLRRLSVNGHYTYLDSKQTAAADILDFSDFNAPRLVPSPEVGMTLLRRPRQSGAFDISWVGERFETSLIGLFVGKRRDLDPVTFSRLAQNKSYAKVDWMGAYRFTPSLALFARIENLLNRNYQEVLGYPAYRLNFSAGMRVRIGGEK
jgi:outer membrane cobalamin receptor